MGLTRMAAPSSLFWTLSTPDRGGRRPRLMFSTAPYSGLPARSKMPPWSMTCVCQAASTASGVRSPPQSSSARAVSRPNSVSSVLLAPGTRSVMMPYRLRCSSLRPRSPMASPTARPARQPLALLIKRGVSRSRSSRVRIKKFLSVKTARMGTFPRRGKKQ